MSQTPLLSIVAAVYNGEKFLAQFFECIEQQQLDSYELILVNDGSTDNSLAVIAEWQERLQNVQVLEQENQGVSVARNTGLAAASGKYLAFPDIDDKLYPGMYRTLLEMAEKEHLDIATCNGTYVYEKRRESHPIFPLDRLPSTDVRQLAAVIDHARLFIGVDSVPMHMAAALGTPLVALFGPSKLTFWRPWQAKGEVIWAGDFGPLPDPDAINTNTDERYLDLIPTDAVIAAAKKVLA
ncbi:glycosyltransferase [Klebsiella pneumoniae]|nr:glycosyltransferase [Klebsiella pneumoniae]